MQVPRDFSTACLMPALVFMVCAFETQLAQAGEPRDLVECGSGRVLRYEVVDGNIFAGDVGVGTLRKFQSDGCVNPSIHLANAPKPKANFGPGSPVPDLLFDLQDLVWPGGRVPYRLNGVSQEWRAAIVQAARQLEQYTGLRYVESNGKEEEFVEFVQFGTPDGACGASDHTGRKLRERVLGIPVGNAGQYIHLSTDKSCAIMGIALHEMLHAAGFGHEHQRVDRNQFVTFNGGISECASNSAQFAVYFANYVTVGAYDYDSIMHYDSKCLAPLRAFSIENARCGVGFVNRAIGQRCGLSDVDIAGVNRFYPIPVPPSLAPGSTAAAIQAAAGLLKPSSSVANTRLAIEFYHGGFGHYFVSADADEIDKLDSGFFSGWTRTGQSFKVFISGGNAVDVCRFFTVAFTPKSSHFYTAINSECNTVKGNKDWQYEKIAFKLALPTAGNCPISTQPLYRLYNNGKTGAPNHRYTTSTVVRSQMIASGFVAEDDNTACVPS